jgi:hypothetical protein
MTLYLLAALLCASTALAAAGDGWIDLFNGRNLDGWVQHAGAAKYRVEGGQIIGTTVPNTPNSFLCTAKPYTNFILEVEFKVDPGLNSGIQLRSSVSDVETTEEWYGKPVKFAPGRVHGLQVEIDPSDRAWTGGLYGEGSIGWFKDLKDNEPARKAFKQGDWNRLRVEARGDMVRTWLNGVPAAELKTDVVRTGFIGLQVHAVGKRTEALEIRFRNVRLQPLP